MKAKKISTITSEQIGEAMDKAVKLGLATYQTNKDGIKEYAITDKGQKHLENLAKEPPCSKK